MALKNASNRALVLRHLQVTTGKNSAQCKAMIRDMPADDFRAILLSSSDLSPLKASNLPSEPVSPKPAPRPSPTPKKRPVGRPRGSKSSSTMKLYSFKAPTELMDELSVLAAKEMTSAAALIRSAVRAFLDEKAKPK